MTVTSKIPCLLTLHDSKNPNEDKTRRQVTCGLTIEIGTSILPLKIVANSNSRMGQPAGDFEANSFPLFYQFAGSSSIEAVGDLSWPLPAVLKQCILPMRLVP